MKLTYSGDDKVYLPVLAEWIEPGATVDIDADAAESLAEHPDWSAAKTTTNKKGQA